MWNTVVSRHWVNSGRYHIILHHHGHCHSQPQTLHVTGRKKEREERSRASERRQRSTSSYLLPAIYDPSNYTLLPHSCDCGFFVWDHRYTRYICLKNKVFGWVWFSSNWTVQFSCCPYDTHKSRKRLHHCQYLVRVSDRTAWKYTVEAGLVQRSQCRLSRWIVDQLSRVVYVSWSPPHTTNQCF